MALTPSDIIWYHAAYDVGEILVSCGEYPNVPLISMHGGISYNPILAKRQFGYPMKNKPNSIALANEFYHNHQDCLAKREKFTQAWKSIRRIGKNQLGRKLNFAHESYTQWVIDRATNFGMPYYILRLLSSTTPSLSLPLPIGTKEEFQEQLAELSCERNTWRKRCQLAELENETLKGELAQKDHLLFTQSQQIIKKDDLVQ
jgi:hypothetical protein